MVGSTQSDAPNLAILSLSAFGSVSAGRRAGTAYYCTVVDTPFVSDERRAIVWLEGELFGLDGQWQRPIRLGGVASYQLETFARAKRRKPMGATNMTQSGF
jgi:hypothetical protein